MHHSSNSFCQDNYVFALENTQVCKFHKPVCLQRKQEDAVPFVFLPFRCFKAFYTFTHAMSTKKSQTTTPLREDLDFSTNNYELNLRLYITLFLHLLHSCCSFLVSCFQTRFARVSAHKAVAMPDDFKLQTPSSSYL